VVYNCHDTDTIWFLNTTIFFHIFHRNRYLFGSKGVQRVLPKSDTEVAVKRVSTGGLKEFISEVISISHLRRRNRNRNRNYLVQLLGYCRRKGELPMVYYCSTACPTVASTSTCTARTASRCWSERRGFRSSRMWHPASSTNQIILYGRSGDVRSHPCGTTSMNYTCLFSRLKAARPDVLTLCLKQRPAPLAVSSMARLASIISY
jgi:hypothetical protein